ncbi:MAG: DNA polymerase III subunit gamma/tau [Chloroflexota bacterium]
MDSQVFYRKWRPQTLADVVGQEHTTITLLNALSSSRVSHAYLFCGPRGTGKTSTGRILAKAVNCLKDGKGEPCNTCDICQAITEGRAIDVIEIDAASNTGVDDIRSLREKVNYAPGQAKYKVYIIDEVHMLSNSASNALLKTLEEPPPNVIFILATTESHKVLPTIISRCQRFDFRRVGQNDIVFKLDHICKSEGIKIKPEALRLIARSASGSLRDAENLMEQLFTFYGSDIKLAQVQSMLGMTGDKRVNDFLKHIINNDISSGMKTINAVNSDGLDLKQFKRELVSYLRHLLLIKNGCDKDLDLTAEEIADLKELASTTSTERILMAVKLFGSLDFSNNDYSTLPFELALVDCSLALTANEPAAVKQLEPEPVRQVKKSTIPTVAAPKKKQPEIKTESFEESSPPVEASKFAPPEADEKLEYLKSNWKQIIEQAPESTRRTAAIAILRSAGVQPVAIDGDTIVLTFKYLYHKEKIEEMENRKTTAEIISNFLGHSCQVRCVYEADENHLVREAQKLGAKITNVEEK